MLTAAMFVLVFLGGIVAGLARWPLAALGVYVLTFYANPPSRWWGHSLPNLRWALVGAAVAVFAAWRYKSRAPSAAKSWSNDSIIGLIIAFLVWMWIQTFWAYGYQDHIQGVTLMSKYLLVAYVIVKLLDSPDAVDFMCIIHVLGCAYFGVLAREVGTGSERLDGVGGPGVDDANTLGMQLATGVLLGTVQMMSGPTWKRALMFICLPFILNGIVLTQSRGAFLGLAVGGLAFYILSPKANRRILKVLGAGGIALFLMVAHEGFWKRMDTIKAEDGQRDFSAETRLVLAKAQVKMFLDHPLGAGHRGTAALSRQYLGTEYMAAGDGVAVENRERSSHNTFLSILTEQGIVGTIIYLALLIALAKRILRIRSLPTDTPERARVALLAAGMGGALTTVFISGQFADYLRAEILIWLYAMTVAISRVASDLKAVQPAPVHDPADLRTRQFAAR